MEETKFEYTPMMKQYLKIKEDYADAIVFFRLGDFYEMFFDDAILASKVLEIALTARDAGKKVPMCGIPYHAAKAYIQKLIEKGYKIAIAEQTTLPGKGLLVEREVVRLITPGTILEDEILNANSNNYISSLMLTENNYALTYIDISTGESYITYGLTKEEACNLIFSLKIKEIVLEKKYDDHIINLLNDNNCLISFYDNAEITENKLIKDLNKDLKKCASHLLNYISSTQKQNIRHLMQFKVELKREYMNIDYRVKRHLEIEESLINNSPTLLSVLDYTQTAMGSRRLKYLLNHPLLDIELLNNRFDLIEAFQVYEYQIELTEVLKYVYDINRIIGRISFQTANARDLWQLKESLKQIPTIKDVLKKYNKPVIDKLNNSIDAQEELCELLDRAIISNPPITIKEGGIIKEGYDETLDGLKYISINGSKWLSDFEEKERERTKVKNLKVAYNRIFGYYIEITKGSLNLVTDDFNYERKQTLANCERFITPELKQKEVDLLTAKDKSINLEYELFRSIREKTNEYSFELQKLANIIADIDVYLNLAVVAMRYNYVRPQISNEKEVKIKKARHVVVERFTEFVENDVSMKENEIILLTGPNMSGKSTYMRMFALIVYMAQVGSFVPAEYAKLPLYDAIFTRIGSSDDLSGGKSTFMVEMIECNEALSKATDRSLILFDEIGRGTATYDGMALAQGIIEYIHEVIKAQTFFSTHYHELTVLDKSLKNLTNLHVKAVEEKNKMVFLHLVEKGASDRSYGLQVAALANLPKNLISRSKAILKKLETKNNVEIDLFTMNFNENIDEDIKLDNDISNLLEEIKFLNLDIVTPIDALLLIKKYQLLLKKKDK